MDVLDLKFSCTNSTNFNPCSSYKPVLIWKEREIKLNLTMNYEGYPHYVIFTMKNNKLVFKVRVEKEKHIQFTLFWKSIKAIEIKQIRPHF